MKRFINILVCGAAFLAAAGTLFAVPARPGKFVRTQPDGTKIVLERHGDEYRHWTTNESGQLVEKNADGFYVVSSRSVAEASVDNDLYASLKRSGVAQSAVYKAANVNTGAVKVPVILIQFSDMNFVSNSAKQDFSNMLNQSNYSANGGTGSVRDFFVDNSDGQFTPSFEVYGPYTASTFSSYNITESNYSSKARTLIQAACSSLNSQIDFSKYDYDNDGYVDMLLVYFAGHNMAEGGEGIWPHQTSNNIGTYDDKTVSRYFCSSELKGYDGEDMCGIGTTVHEFSHSLGLPDFYDTDYETNGEAAGIYSYSTMCSGPYLNDGCTPPYFSLEEKIMLGWVAGSSIVQLSNPGEYTLGKVGDNTAYKMATSTSNEYFLFEARGYGKWDAYLPGKGMVIYHVDKSSRNVSIIYGGSTYNVAASRLWNNWSDNSYYHNAINENGSHPCYYVIPAAAQKSLYFHGNEASIPFPGSTGINQYLPVDWNGNEGKLLKDIHYNSDGSVSFTIAENKKAVYGQVVDKDGHPVAGAKVKVLSSSSSSAVNASSASGSRFITGNAPVFKSLAASTADLTVQTDENGNYYLDLSSETDDLFRIGATASGFVGDVKTVKVENSSVSQRLVLFPSGYNQDGVYMKFDDSDDGDWGYVWGLSYDGGSTFESDYMVSAAWTEEELTPIAGRRIETIAFLPYVGSSSSTTFATSTHLLIEFGSKRKLWVPVTEVTYVNGSETLTASSPVANTFNYVDISKYNIYIPENEEIHVGYAVKGAKVPQGIIIGLDFAQGAGYIAEYDATSSFWIDWYDVTVVMYLSMDTPISGNGFNIIDNPELGVYRSGDTFSFVLNATTSEGRIPKSVTWYVDDEKISGSSVVLTKGTHVVEAHLVLDSGRKKIVEQKIRVE